MASPFATYSVAEKTRPSAALSRGALADAAEILDVEVLHGLRPGVDEVRRLADVVGLAGRAHRVRIAQRASAGLFDGFRNRRLPGRLAACHAAAIGAGGASQPRPSAGPPASRARRRRPSRPCRPAVRRSPAIAARCGRRSRRRDAYGPASRRERRAPPRSKVQSVCRKAAAFAMSSGVRACATVFITLPCGRSSVRWNTSNCLAR